MSHDLPPLPTIAPGFYRHHKGGEYEVLGVVRHSESLEPMVLYRPLVGAMAPWVRPFAMFVETVEVDGRRQPRFARLGDGEVPVTPPVVPVRVRRLDATDAEAFQALRLRALRDEPSAFGSSVEEEQERTPEQVAAVLSGSPERVFFGAWHEQVLVGLVGVGREAARKERHIAHLRSLYVAPEARGHGVGLRLVDSALAQAFAWPGVEQILLSATAGNAAAIGLYRRAGFVQVGFVPHALRLGDVDADELIMMLRRPPALAPDR